MVERSMVRPALLYHNVLKLDQLRSILDSGVLRVNQRLLIPSISFTRDSTYLTSRGIQLVFDRDRLRQRVRLVPFCYPGWRRLYHPELRPLAAQDEYEERALGNVEIRHSLVAINLHPRMNYQLPLAYSRFIC